MTHIFLVEISSGFRTKSIIVVSTWNSGGTILNSRHVPSARHPQIPNQFSAMIRVGLLTNWLKCSPRRNWGKSAKAVSDPVPKCAPYQAMERVTRTAFLGKRSVDPCHYFLTTGKRMPHQLASSPTERHAFWVSVKQTARV
jgi:hypothetical protein